jgi:hypothetical protein
MVRRRAIELVICATALAPGACGRFDFDALADAGGAPDAASDATLDAPPSRIAYVGPFVQRSPGTGPNESFAAQAHAVGNAVVIQVSCAANAVPTAVSVVAPGWSFMQLGPITASASSVQRSATFAAIAPDTIGTMVTVTWSGSNCNSSKNEVGDEFAMTDPAGGIITFDGVSATEGTGNCTGKVISGHAGDAVWAACNSQNSVTAVGSGFLKGADDNAGDWSEYAITDHPADTVETVEFTNGNVGYVLSMVTLKAR